MKITRSMRKRGMIGRRRLLYHVSDSFLKKEVGKDYPKEEETVRLWNTDVVVEESCSATVPENVEVEMPNTGIGELPEVLTFQIPKSKKMSILLPMSMGERDVAVMMGEGFLRKKP
ncbi:hypothetical protein L6452_13808 [Arctium lappa]|uniref:Uncharacterized protein n=1 Tax=Arctium lappa TaxID=4217 RepID=A0ACB9CJ81_ARCLA|nr:hypothetical protein L6452_13808 [Arctium lappa]